MLLQYLIENSNLNIHLKHKSIDFLISNVKIAKFFGTFLSFNKNQVKKSSSFTYINGIYTSILFLINHPLSLQYSYNAITSCEGQHIIICRNCGICYIFHFFLEKFFLSIINYLYIVYL